MTFLRYKDTDFWWEIDYDKMKVYNYHGGWHDINENSEEYMYGEICEANSWRDLYLKKHFDPTEVDLAFCDNVWISPVGTYHNGEAHAVMAEDICEIWYGLDTSFNAEFFLEEKGWIKASRYFWDMHLDDYNNYHLWEMTYSQYEALYDWCLFYGIKFPADIIEIKE